MDRKYNSIYNKLVQSDKDLVGLVAYAIYKRHKIEFVSGVKRSKEREPTDEECEVFFAASMADSQINKYRSEAKTLLSEVVANTKKEEIEQFEAEMLSNYQENIKNCLPPWWQNTHPGGSYPEARSSRRAGTIHSTPADTASDYH